MLVTCTNCQSKIKVPDAAAGKKGKCPKCGTIIAIPALEAADEPTPAEAPAGGSPFDFDAPPPAPAKKGRKAADEAVDDDVIGADGEAKPGKKKEESQVLSIIALVLGILSLVCGCGSSVAWYCAPLPFLMAIAAIITGLMGMKRGGRMMGIIGASLGGVSILLTIIAIVIGIVFGAAIMGAIGLGAMKAG